MITKQQLQKLTAIFESQAKRIAMIDDTDHVRLSVYSPGDGRRYQMQVCDSEHQMRRAFPRDRHLPVADFKGYILGLLEGLDWVEFESRAEA